MSRFRFTTLHMLATVLLASLTQQGHAQLLVSIDVPRDSYVQQEPTLVTVTVENRAGKDIVLGGPGGKSWLQMEIKEISAERPEGNLLSGRNNQEPSPKTLVLKDGESTQRKVDLQAFYPMQTGQFTVNCSVYFSDLDRWVGPERSKPVLITSPRKPFFEQTVGTNGDTGSSSYRRYKLFSSPSTFQEGALKTPRNLIYMQLVDEQNDETIQIYPIGELMRFYPPQPTTDAGGNLHVLFQSTPRMFAHAMVDAKGQLKVFDTYETVEGSRPQLVRNNSGVVAVRGGRFYDPRVEVLAQQQRAKTERSLSDRPAGLPEEKEKP